MKKIFENKKEILLVLFLLAVSGVSHGINMFGFPYYENDEGSYISQAWSLLKFGKFAPYTYWYDHAPGGWVLIALWAKLTGGFFTFGPSINSGRVLMLVLHILTTLLLYIFAKKVTKKREVGLLAGLIFSFSPLGIYYQRRVLLDNIMTFWLYASLVLVADEKIKISKTVLSGILFGLAVLSKEVAVIFLPLFLYLLFINSDKHNRHFTITNFLVIAFGTVSLYFLYALLKGELLPVSGRVSLLSTILWQSGRGQGLPFWNIGSDFYLGLIDWLNKDRLIIILGLISLMTASVMALFKREFKITALMGILFMAFLLRGSLIIGLYVIPLISIFALISAQVWDLVIKFISFKNKTAYRLIMLTSVVLIPAIFLRNHLEVYRRKETRPQVDAIVWVKDNIPENSYIAIDNYMYVDLKEPGYVNNKVYPNADWFWKISDDSDVKDNKYNGDLRTLEYVVLSHEMLKQIKDGNLDYLKWTLENSDEINRWTTNSTSYLDFANYISTNGDWMSVLKRKNMEDIYLADSWNVYKSNFIHSYGQVVDPEGNITTSEGQSYAMLRAMWMGDEETFDGVWGWTKDHMQYRTEDKLLSWLWAKDETGKEKLLDTNSASDADEDIALALLFASKKFNNPNYYSDAMQIINDIWDNEVVKVKGRFLLLSAPKAGGVGEHLVNPSYFSPATYRIFAQVDPTHDWNSLASDSYYYLNLISSSSGDKNLPPNWIVVTNSGNIKSAKKYIAESPGVYGYDAFRVFWRLSLDLNWNHSDSAKEFLERSNKFFEKEWNDKTKINAIYELNGTPLVSYHDFSTTTGALSVLSATDQSTAKDLFDKTYSDLVYGKNPPKLNYYSDNWVWFSMALYFNELPNLFLENAKITP